MDSYTIGVGSAVLTEILKFFPMLRRNTLVVAVLAIVVNALAVYFQGANGLTFQDFMTALVVSLATYFGAIKPVAGAMGSPTQK